MIYFVYILGNSKGSWFYKGMTSSLTNRLSIHEKGYCKSTKQHLPLQLIHVEICDSRSVARKLEEFFKTGYGREIIKELWRVRLVA